MLDIQVPISLQPRDKIQDIVDLCIKKFSNCQPEVARKRVGIFLKNCRKTEKRKIQDHRPSRGVNAKVKLPRLFAVRIHLIHTVKYENRLQLNIVIFSEEKETQEGIAS